MPFRLVGHAEDRIDTVLLDSARPWGIPAAARYHRLILAAAAAIAESPALLGSRDIPGLFGLRTLDLRTARRFIPTEDRVADPRHLIIYRVAPDGRRDPQSHPRSHVASKSKSKRFEGGRQLTE